MLTVNEGSCNLMKAMPATYIRGIADIVAGTIWFKACKRKVWGRVWQ